MMRTLGARLDPRPAWRLLRQPLPEDEDRRRLARGVRRLAWMLLVVAGATFLILVAAAAGYAMMLMLLGSTFPILGALFEGMFWVMLAEIALGILLVALLLRFALAPVAGAYDRVLRGEPIPRWLARGGGLVALAASLAAPTAFLTVFFATTTAPILIGTFLATLASPFLLLSGLALLRAPAPLVA